MTIANLTQDVPPKPFGYGGRNVALPQAATAQIWQGAMVATTADGSVVTGTTSGSGHCIGVAVFGQLGGATDGASRMLVWTDKIFGFQPGLHAPSDSTPFGTVLFMESDNQVGTGAGGETQIAGRFYGFEDDGTVRVYISSQASWFDANADLNDGGTSAFKARAVMTTLQASYTGSTTGTLTGPANTALSASDGVTLAVGDVVFIPPAITNIEAASDGGPYVVTALGSGSSSWGLTRPAWWMTGSAAQLGQAVDIGGEGTKWGGNTWKCFGAKG